MKDLILDYLQRWTNLGGDMIMAASLVEYNTSFGSAGLLQDLKTISPQF